MTLSNRFIAACIATIGGLSAQPAQAGNAMALSSQEIIEGVSISPAEAMAVKKTMFRTCSEHGFQVAIPIKIYFDIVSADKFNLTDDNRRYHLSTMERKAQSTLDGMINDPSQLEGLIDGGLQMDFMRTLFAHSRNYYRDEGLFYLYEPAGPMAIMPGCEDITAENYTQGIEVLDQIRMQKPSVNEIPGLVAKGRSVTAPAPLINL